MPNFRILAQQTGKFECYALYKLSIICMTEFGHFRRTSEHACFPPAGSGVSVSEALAGTPASAIFEERASPEGLYCGLQIARLIQMQTFTISVNA